MKYWLMKSDPDSYGWPDLLSQKNKTDHWDGVRNYQARNYMKEMTVGDKILFYHSQLKPPHIIGVAAVAREAYPDHTQFDPSDKHYDPKSSKDDPRWFMVDIRAESAFDPPITLPELKETAGLEEMVLLRRGSRLSIQPVTAKEWKIVTSLRK